MKKILPFASIFLGIIFVFVTSCSKNKNTSQEQTYSDQISMMVEHAGSQMDSLEVLTDESTPDIYMMNSGISADFLIDETFITDDQSAGQGENFQEYVYIRDHSFIRCLMKLSLSVTQKMKVRESLHGYKTCTDHAVKRAKEIYSDLQLKYKTKYQRLWNAFQSGTITGQEFKKLVTQLQMEFKKELRQLHLKEKLDEALKQCLRLFFSDLHGILSERQWNTFLKCYLE